MKSTSIKRSEHIARHLYPHFLNCDVIICHCSDVCDNISARFQIVASWHETFYIVSLKIHKNLPFKPWKFPWDYFWWKLISSGFAHEKVHVEISADGKYFWIKYEMIITAGIYLIKAIFPCSNDEWRAEAKKALSRATWTDRRCLYTPAQASYNGNYYIVHPNPKIRLGCCWQLAYE